MCQPINYSIFDLPVELSGLIFSKLPVQNALLLMMTCKLYWNCSREMFLNLLVLYFPNEKMDDITEENYAPRLESLKSCLKEKIVTEKRINQNQIDGIFTVESVFCGNFLNKFHPVNFVKDPDAAQVNFNLLCSMEICQNGLIFDLAFKDFENRGMHHTANVGLKEACITIKKEETKELIHSYSCFVHQNTPGFFACERGVLAFPEFNVRVLKFDISEWDCLNYIITKHNFPNLEAQQIPLKFKKEICVVLGEKVPASAIDNTIKKYLQNINGYLKVQGILKQMREAALNSNNK